ncbi:MAG: aminotransferase class V-fold PLP-dependent enzyme [Acidobacteriota bacterium]|nr:aminotransferase class V-fold PLP-dependent enzyme [Acidobacteriota bacterium]
MDSRLQALGRTARKLDRNDPLKQFRKRFRVSPGKIYLDGNSLGLLSRDGEATLKQTLHSWRDLAIGGWLEADRPWFTLAEWMGARCAGLVGARPDEVVMSGTTTVNIHALVQTFYRPEDRRTRILAGGLDFPSDIYALKSILRLRGFDPGEHLILAKSRNGHTFDEDDIVRLMDERTALVFLPSVLYRSGQLLNMELLTLRAREKGIPIGFDCAHSVGAVPHELSKWGVDFAVWCSYK